MCEPDFFKCDGESDCTDGADELGCGEFTSLDTDSISEPSSEIWKTRFILIWHCKRQRKIRCLERDLNSHLRVSRPPLYRAIELSSQLGLVASLIQFKCTKYFRDHSTLIFEDAQCFNSISEPSLEIWKTRFILVWHCKRQRILLETTNFSLSFAVSD